jgi:hypothetical protein
VKNLLSSQINGDNLQITVVETDTEINRKRNYVLRMKFTLYGINYKFWGYIQEI